MTTKQDQEQNANLNEEEANAPPADEFEAAFNEFSGAKPDNDPPPANEEGRGNDDGEGDTDAAAKEAAEAVTEKPEPAEKAGKDTNKQPEGGDQPPEGVKPEVWNAASPDLKAYLRDQAKKIADLEHAERSNRGRISALQRQLQGTAPAKPGAGKGAGKPKSILDDPALKKAVEEFPEVMGPLTPTLQQMDERTRRIEEALAQMNEGAREAYYLSQEDELTKAHPDWREITASREFGEWLTKQPKYVQDGIVRNGEHIVDAFEAADIVRRFKDQTQAPQNPPNPQPQSNGQGKPNLDAKRQRQLQGAVTVTGKSGGGAANPPDDFEAAFNHYATRKARQAQV